MNGPLSSQIHSDVSFHPEWSIEQHRVADTSATISMFDDDIWVLKALPVTPGAAISNSLNFTALNEKWGQVARWLAYCWINKPTPAVLRYSPNSRRVDFPSSQTVRQRVFYLISTLQWIIGQGVNDPSEIDDEHIVDLALHLKEVGDSPALTDRKLEVFLLWAAASENLPEEVRLPEGLQVTVPTLAKHRNHGGNRTRRIRQATMGPMLWWSLRMVDTYADDAFELFDLVKEPHVTPIRPESRSNIRDSVTGRFLPDVTGQTQLAQAQQLFEQAIQLGQPVPSWREGQIAFMYLEWLHGIGSDSLSAAVRDVANELPLADRTNCPVKQASELPDGLSAFAGYYDLIGQTSTNNTWPNLARLLQAACLINVAYMTGMRSDEVRRLRRGCSEIVALPGGGTRHLIRGTVTKTSKTDDGLHAGSRVEEEAVWVTIPAATRSLHLAEKLRARFAPDSEWIFNNPHRTGNMLLSDAAALEIAFFFNTINSRDDTDTHDHFPNIPNDTHGAITLRRFRRTLAWYVRNQPHGEVTLGIQYQHVGTVVGSGYAAAGSDGWADLLDEEGLVTRQRLTETLRDQFLQGAGISGLGAARATSAVAEFDAAGATYMPVSDMKRLLTAPGMTIYDNPSNLSLCVYDPEKAKCERVSDTLGKGAEPNLLGCRSGCSNQAMTDAQADLLAARATETRMQSELAPTPLKNRLLLAAQEMDERVKQHKTNRIIPTVVEGEEQW